MPITVDDVVNARVGVQGDQRGGIISLTMSLAADSPT